MDRLRTLRLPAGLQDSLVVTGSTFFAGLLDYATNVLSGQLLQPVHYAQFISVMALLQLSLHVTNVVRNLVAYHSAVLTTQAGRLEIIGRFFRTQFRRAVWAGLAAAAIAAALAPLAAGWLNFPSTRPLQAGVLALFMLIVRPVTDGTLQGIQNFNGLSAVNVLQAVLRVTATVLFIRLGWEAAGAILGLPLATTSALFLALWLLRPQWQAASPEQPVPTLRTAYTLWTLTGLLAFAVMANIDAILVQSRFPGEVASSYSPLVTLGKINLFLPLALGLVLFPKAVERHRQGRSGIRLILLTQIAVLLPGLAVTVTYFAYPAFILAFVFGGAYASLGPIMGFVGLATSLFALTYLWLQYALSLEIQWYPLLLLALAVLQGVGMAWLSPNLNGFVGFMIASGLLANAAGLALLRYRPPGSG